MKTSLAGLGRPVIHRAAPGAVGRAVAWCGGWEAKVWKGWRDADAASNMLWSVCGGIGYRFGPRMRATLHGWLVRKRTHISIRRSHRGELVHPRRSCFLRASRSWDDTRTHLLRARGVGKCHLDTKTEGSARARHGGTTPTRGPQCVGQFPRNRGSTASHAAVEKGS